MVTSRRQRVVIITVDIILLIARIVLIKITHTLNTKFAPTCIHLLFWSRWHTYAQQIVKLKVVFTTRKCQSHTLAVCLFSAYRESSGLNGRKVWACRHQQLHLWPLSCFSSLSLVNNIFIFHCPLAKVAVKYMDVLVVLLTYSLMPTLHVISVEWSGNELDFLLVHFFICLFLWHKNPWLLKQKQKK